MPVTNYLTVDGEILSEVRDTTTRDYVPDPLGSTLLLLDTTQTITDRFDWWPYGELRSHTGSSATPFGYVGTMGYYADQVSDRLYVRARYLRPQTGRWQTVDPLWPEQNAYEYAYAAPTTYVDDTGEEALAITIGIGILCPECVGIALAACAAAVVVVGVYKIGEALLSPPVVSPFPSQPWSGPKAPSQAQPKDQPKWPPFAKPWNPPRKRPWQRRSDFCTVAEGLCFRACIGVPIGPLPIEVAPGTHNGDCAAACRAAKKSVINPASFPTTRKPCKSVNLLKYLSC